MHSDTSRAALAERYADLLDTRDGDAVAFLDVVAEVDVLCGAIQPLSPPPPLALAEREQPTFTFDDSALETGSEMAAFHLPLAFIARDTNGDARRNPGSQRPAWRVLARAGRRMVAAGLVAVLVLGFAALLVQRTHSSQPVSEPQATAT